jgi:predicted alpha/beta-fold hydrolase
LLAPTNRIRFFRDRVETPDGDFIDFDWNAPSLPRTPKRAQDAALTHTAATDWLDQAGRQALGLAPAAPALVLLHGLEGSSKSRYAQSITQYFRQAGWTVVVAHFRGCSGFANRLARAYHSGDSTEIRFILETVRASFPEGDWHAVGISLGGNALLKYMGESPQEVAWLNAAAAISAPLDLVAAGNHLSDDRFNREIYSRYFLRTLRPKVLKKAERFPGVIDTIRIHQARDLRDFDSAYTAPMHGFSDALDYWTQCSSKRWLAHIRTPTLVLNARNDPFLPEATLPGPATASAQVELHQPAQGGHFSFVTGAWPGHLRWLAQRIETFFTSR